jgi:hypothetical protein
MRPMTRDPIPIGVPMAGDPGCMVRNWARRGGTDDNGTRDEAAKDKNERYNLKQDSAHHLFTSDRRILL